MTFRRGKSISDGPARTCRHPHYEFEKLFVQVESRSRAGLDCLQTLGAHGKQAAHIDNSDLKRQADADALQPSADGSL